MPKPYEIIAAPFTVWWAPVGEAFPVVDDAPAGNWAQIGTSGDRNYTEAGVTITHSQTIEKFRMLGGTGARKANRTEEDFMVGFTLADLTLEQYRLALNNNTVTTTAAGAGTAGFKEAPIYRGVDVAQMALLVRGIFSPYGDGWNCQFEVPVVFQSGNPEPVFSKGAPAGLALQFEALEDPDAAGADDRFGKVRFQDADPV